MNTSTSRRRFLKTALSLPAALAVGGTFKLEAADSSAAPDAGALPMRTLGRSGRKVTMVSLGGAMGAYGPDYIDIAWSMGIRYFDTASDYLNGHSENLLGQWLARHPERRQEVFIVTKDSPRGPQELLKTIDQRLVALGTSYLDGFFIHGIGKDYGAASLDWPKSDEFRKTAEQLRSSGKVKLVGFSCHDDRRADYLMSAAKGGFLDLVMVKYTPFFTKGDPFDQAVQACHDAGIGLVAMKTMRNSNDVPARLPEFDKMGLEVHQALLQAVWSDPRIAAVCNHIENVGQMASSTGAARAFKGPLHTAQMETLREVVIAGRRTMCPGCTACDEYGAGAPLAFQDIARFVTYYEQDGNLEARAIFQKLPAGRRDFASVDLEGLRERCAFKTDYPEIMKRAARYFV